MTRIEAVRKGRGYVILELEGRESLRIPQPLYRERKYKEGQPFDEKSYAELLENREYPNALDDAVKLLSLRARSEQEVYRYLTGRAYREIIVAKVMARLTQAGYLKDAVFADHYALSKAARATGPHRLRQELRQKGVDSELIENTLAQIDPEEQLRVAAEHAEKLLRRLKGKDARDQQHKVLQALARRGYGYDLSKQALERALSGDLDRDLFYEED